jgi:hypothetical protein
MVELAAVLVPENCVTPPCAWALIVTVPAGLLPKSGGAPPMLFMIVELAAVLASKNCMVPPLLLMVELAAVLVLKNCTIPALLVMMALSAVLARPWNTKPVLCRTLEIVKVGLFEELLEIPAPVIVKVEFASPKEYAGAPALNWSAPIDALPDKVTSAVFGEMGKMAVPVGTVAGNQLPAVFQAGVVGVQIASGVSATTAPRHAQKSGIKRPWRHPRFRLNRHATAWPRVAVEE